MKQIIIQFLWRLDKNVSQVDLCVWTLDLFQTGHPNLASGQDPSEFQCKFQVEKQMIMAYDIITVSILPAHPHHLFWNWNSKWKSGFGPQVFFCLQSLLFWGVQSCFFSSTWIQTVTTCSIPSSPSGSRAGLLTSHSKIFIVSQF